MPELLKSLILGLVQGVTEFLPVSSSGHLALVESFTGVKTHLVLLNVILHTGSLAAICIYYRGSLLRIASSFARSLAGMAGKDERKQAAFAAYVILADAVTLLVAIPLYVPTETISGRTGCIGWFLVLTGVMLVLTRFLDPGRSPLSWKGAILIGFFQGIAVLPGISRSGATIFAALLLGMEGKEAVRFSFLMAIPVVAGAAAFESAFGIGEIRGSLLLFAPGALASFLSALLCLRILEKMTVRRHLHWFAFYLLPAGLALAFFAR